MTPQVELVFALFEVQVKLLRRDAVEPMQAMSGEALEALDPADVTVAARELVRPVGDAEVLPV
jgi:hypothetical protein